jgi:hypothetical protein
MSLRSNKKKASKVISSMTQKEQKSAFVDILSGDDFEDYVSFLKSPKKTFFFNFLRGTGFGLGTVLGTALVLSLIVYIFSFFVKIPYLGEFINRLFGNIKI